MKKKKTHFLIDVDEGVFFSCFFFSLSLSLTLFREDLTKFWTGSAGGWILPYCSNEYRSIYANRTDQYVAMTSSWRIASHYLPQPLFRSYIDTTRYRRRTSTRLCWSPSRSSQESIQSKWNGLQKKKKKDQVILRCIRGVSLFTCVFRDCPQDGKLPSSATEAERICAAKR